MQNFVEEPMKYEVSHEQPEINEIYALKLRNDGVQYAE